MRTRIFSTILIPLCAMLFQFCDEPSHIVTMDDNVQPPEPPIVIPTGVQLAVGNTYHWRYTQFTNHGSFFQWDETYNVVRETTVGGKQYFVISTGEVLKSDGDSVLSYAHDSIAVYYRFRVSEGQTVPFMGHMFAVANVETDSVFSEVQKIVMVLPQALSPAGMDQGRYSTKFGLLDITRSDSVSVTRGVLIGARIGNVNYGH